MQLHVKPDTYYTTLNGGRIDIVCFWANRMNELLLMMTGEVHSWYVVSPGPWAMPWKSKHSSAISEPISALMVLFMPPIIALNAAIFLLVILYNISRNNQPHHTWGVLLRVFVLLTLLAWGGRGQKEVQFFLQILLCRGYFSSPIAWSGPLPAAAFWILRLCTQRWTRWV